ncbi:hypothetical protein [Embleya sp. NPDC005971]|uniref:hypothetical protein n=1 Tax=Embleya sp. NPDC005971 TaxID=3156724 RepID=UPI0034022870
MAEHIEDREHDEPEPGGGGGRCPLGARSAHACDGPTDDAGELLLGWVAACGGAEDSVLGCAVHLGERLSLICLKVNRSEFDRDSGS